MLSQLRNSFRRVRIEFLNGIKSHLSVRPNIATIISLLIGWWTCFDTWSMFLSIELMILLQITWNSSKCSNLIPWLVRFLFTRAVVWWLFYTIYSEWYEDFSLMTVLSFLGFPLLLSWYLFDPYLLITKRFSMSDRFDYFLSRLPFFTGFGLIPLMLFLIWWSSSLNIILYYSIYSTICIICSHITEHIDKMPEYAKYIPYTTVKFTIDPLEYIEDYISSL